MGLPVQVLIAVGGSTGRGTYSSGWVCPLVEVRIAEGGSTGRSRYSSGWVYW